MKQTVLWAMAIMILAACPETRANPTIRDQWLGSYPDPCAPLITAANNCSLCHSSVPQRNAYGADLEGLSDLTSVDNVDSDGDSVVNGVEIRTDCTLPGDPNSVQVDEEIWSNIKRLYR